MSTFSLRIHRPDRSGAQIHTGAHAAPCRTGPGRGRAMPFCVVRYPVNTIVMVSCCDKAPCRFTLNRNHGITDIILHCTACLHSYHTFTCNVAAGCGRCSAMFEVFGQTGLVSYLHGSAESLRTIRQKRWRQAGGEIRPVSLLNLRNAASHSFIQALRTRGSGVRDSCDLIGCKSIGIVDLSAQLLRKLCGELRGFAMRLICVAVK